MSQTDREDWPSDEDELLRRNAEGIRSSRRAAAAYAAAGLTASTVASRAHGKLRVALVVVAGLLLLAAAWISVVTETLNAILRKVGAIRT